MMVAMWLQPLRKPLGAAPGGDQASPWTVIRTQGDSQESPARIGVSRWSQDMCI